MDITDDLDVYVEEDNNNNLDAKEEEDNNIDVLCVQTSSLTRKSRWW